MLQSVPYGSCVEYRSKYFSTLFSSGFEDAASAVHQLDDSTAEAAQSVVKGMYTHKVPSLGL